LVESYQERRDCLDQRWYPIATRLGFVPVPLPNIQQENVEDIVSSLPVDGLLLSGGNSVHGLDANAPDAAPERDHFEKYLIDHAIREDIPVLGICRGMQVINLHLGGNLSPVAGHVASRHRIVVAEEVSLTLPTEVNSFHAWGIARPDLAASLTCLATDNEGHVEAFRHSDHRVAGIMWHPEREQPPRDVDLDLMEFFLT
jgi:putative glutamine amidotransferase